MAGTTGSLASLLEESELGQIPTALQEKLKKILNSQETELDDFKSKYEKLRVNSEQQYFEIEKQLITSNSKLERETTSNDELQRRVIELEEKYSSASTKLKDTEETQGNALSSQLQLNRANAQLESEKRDLTVLLEKKNKEIDSINEEWKTYTQKVSDAIKEKCEAQAKLSEAESKADSLEFQNRRFAQEKQQLQQQLDLLDEQMLQKTNELLSLRKEQSSSLLDIQNQLESKIEENNLQQDTIETLKRTNADQVAKLDDYMKRLSEIRDGQSQSEEQYRQELQAKTKLADLYKKSAEEADNQVKEVTQAVKELQRLLKEATDAYTELEKSKEDDAKNLQLEIQEREETIGKLRSELVNANDLLEQARNKVASDEQVESMFPTAAATSKLIQSGMTLTQIYNEYVQASDALILEKEENQRLNSYLTQILKEIEEKAPILRKQREDYENCIHNNEQLTRQLDSFLLESQNKRLEADDINRKYNHMQRENQKLQQQTIDLSRQVQYLVKEIEELRGGRVIYEDEVSSTEATNSDEVISSKLVTFRHIKDLQTQNQRLIAVIRELSEKHEEEEKAKRESHSKDLRDKLELAQTEISELKSSRDKQKDMVEAIVRQRDMYRVLLQQEGQGSLSTSVLKTPDKSAPQVKSPVALKSPGTDPTLQETSKALIQLQEDFSHYKKEKATNETILNEQLDKSRKDNSEMRLQNSKLSSQLDFASERYKVLQGNADAYRKEIASLRDKVQKYSCSVAKHEQTINTLKQELMVTNEKAIRFEAQCQNMRVEKELLKNSEQRLVQEVESERREKKSQNMLMANLQSIQNSLQHSEYETKNRYNKKIESLELEVNSLRRKLHLEVDENKAFKNLMENQNKTVREQLDTELRNHDQDKQLVKSLREELEEAKQQLSAAESKLSSAENRFANASTDGTESSVNGQLLAANEEVKDLRSQMQQNQQESRSLKDKLQLTQQNVEQYKSIADGLQKAISEQSQATSQYEEKYEDLGEAKKRAEKRLEEVEKERTDLVNENVRISEESHALNADLRKQLANLQNELQEAVQRRELAISKETEALQESQTQIAIAKEMQDKYQRELMLHAGDVEAMNAVKKQMDNFNQKLATEQESRMRAEKELEAGKGSWENQQKSLQQEIKRLETRCKDLNTQNNLIHNQMEKMSRDVISVQQAVARRESLSSATEDTSKSSEQLLEVVKYLRKEKEIAETKLEVVQAESTNNRQQLDRATKQLEEANKSLREERENSQVSLQTAAQHAELMRKVENLNLLTDSNRLLREEKDRLEQQEQTMEAKLKKLETDIEPMQASLRDVTAQRDAYKGEKAVLEEEVNRWKSRTNHLIEQANKTDPEEHRKLIQERETLRRDMARLKDECQKSGAEISRLNNNMANIQKELNAVKTESAQLKKEKEEYTTVGEMKDKELEERQKTITQLKKIGRKYKEQAESISKELEELKTKQSEQAPPAPSAEAIQQATAPLQEKLTNTQKELEEYKQKLNTTTTEINTQKEEASKLQQVNSQHKQEYTKLQEESTKTKNDFNKLKEEKEELDKKLNQSKTVLQAAKKKISSQNEHIEKLSNENGELKQKAASVGKVTDMEAQKTAALKSSYEEKISKLEEELNNAKNTSESAASTATELQAVIDKLSEENTELLNKIQVLQKQHETPSQPVPPQPQVPRSSATVSVERTSAPATETPKTANIKPMASPATVKTREVQSAATKATASIRPMAIAPSSVTPISVSVPTPMATVMPTTVSVPDSQASDQVSQLSPATSTRPTSHVQRVPPQVEMGSESTAQETDSSQPETAAVEPQPSTSSGSGQAKRSREDMDSQEEEIDSKRTKVSVEPQTLPSITVTDEHANTSSIQSEDATQVVDEAATQASEESWSQQTQVVNIESLDSQATLPDFEAEEDAERTQQEQDDDAVIVLESDEEEEEEEDEDDEDDDEEEYEEDDDEDGYENMEGEYEEEGAEGGEQEEEEFEGEGEMDEDYQSGDMETGGQEEGDEDDEEDVVIVEDDDNADQMEQQETEALPVTQSVAPSTQAVINQRPIQVLHSMERQTSLPRNQLTPFVLAGQGGAFEDHGDDSIVPSTPTLFVPNRGDGFAEAVSSPQIPHQRFTFGSGVEVSQHELAQLESQGALGLDDTRMDLSQLEEGSGRSVPTTPLHVTPPVTVLTEMAESAPSQTAPSASEQGEQESQEPVTDSTQDESGNAIASDQTIEVGQETGEDKSEPTESAVEEETETAGEGSKEESSASTSQDKTDSLNKPKKIQPIVWEGTQNRQETGHTQAPMQGHFRGRGQQIGHVRPPSHHQRGRGNFPRARSPLTRGQRPPRGGNRGNMYGRPPMY